LEKRDYYELLGISPNATEIEIKKAYRALAIRHHPDKNQGDPQSESFFKEIAEAYNVLLNPRDRALYEQFGHSLAPANIPQKETKNINLMDVIFNATSDFLDQLFAGKNDSKFQVSRGSNHRYKVDLTFQDIARGKKMPISYKRLQTCNSCKGSGAIAGTCSLICPRCQGRGEERKIGSLLTRTTCIGCNGKGKVIPEPCPDCQGEGRISKKRKITVSIPPGTSDGDILKIESEGEAGENGGPYGDLYVVVRVK
jgi:molecular chaperone DnaJ